jgi:shikimate kinase
MTTKQNIFLIGPMGAGKTSVGKLLAKALKFDFYDSDQIIEQQSGADIPWIFDVEGESGFRKRETKTLDQLSQKKNIVLATGGGIILNPENRNLLATRGLVFYLYTTIDEQVKRTDRSRNRPLILNKNARQIFEKLKAERELLYREIADHIIDTGHGSVRAIVDEILSKINRN